jgi:hypothetical protein
MIERRTFLCWLVSGAAALPLRGVHLHAQAAALSPQAVTTLREVAAVVLPSELRRAGHDKVVNDFVQWLTSYRAGAERSWGYGHPRKSGTVAIEPARYVDQLAAIAGRAGRTGLAALPGAQQREIVLAAIEESGVRELPAAPNGRHIVTDVMSFFFNSSTALDLAYHAQIRRGTCRGLAGATAKPTAAGD